MPLECGRVGHARVILVLGECGRGRGETEKKKKKKKKENRER